MRRFSFCIAIAAAALVVAPAALADGPGFATQGGTGVASLAHPGIHYVAVPVYGGGTLLETVDVRHGGIYLWARLAGSWGIPTIGIKSIGAGLSRDGRTLVLAPPGPGLYSPTKFLVVDARRMRPIRTIVLEGAYSFDALSPDASRMYVIQYADAFDLSHYIVRAYDMRTNRLLPGKIADRTEEEGTMAGSAMTRTTSADGRWVYTLYEKPTGEGFIHALDTVGGVAHCIDLPKNRGLFNVGLSLRDGGRTLAATWKNGRPWLDVAVGSTWRVSYPAGTAFPWAWLAAAIGGGLAVLAALALAVRRRGKGARRAGQELGLAR